MNSELFSNPSFWVEFGGFAFSHVLVKLEMEREIAATIIGHSTKDIVCPHLFPLFYNSAGKVGID